jgi:hypothetical protein
MPIPYLTEHPQAVRDLNDGDLALLDQMIDSLVSDIESCWSSSIACCDECFDEYTAKWPLAYTSSSGVQYQSVPADVFYDGSKELNQILTKEQFQRLLPYVACPSCFRPLGPNLFAFELPFDAAEYERDLKRLSGLAMRAPFLVAADPFAKKIRTAIKHLCASSKPELISDELYRARSVKIASATPADFGPPPPSCTREGRYNHAGRPVLYVANSYETCWEECRRPVAPFSIATLKFVRPIRLLDLSEPEDMRGVLSPVMYSNLVAAPSEGSGWDKPEYVLTRFVGDCARVAGVDGIRYLSTRTGDGSNIVLLNGSVAMTFIEVTKIQEMKRHR